MSRSKDIGTKAETAVVRALQARGWEATRVPLAGNADRGDVHATLPLTGLRYIIEVKAGHQAEQASWNRCADWFYDEAMPAAAREPGIPLLVVKRKGHADPLQWRVFFVTGGILAETRLAELIEGLRYEDAPELLVAEFLT